MVKITNVFIMVIENENKPVARKKFVLWALGILSTLTTVKYLFRPTQRNKTTAKMLTQDGKLVEVELSRLSGKKTKIKDAEIHKWIKRKSPL